QCIRTYDSCFASYHASSTWRDSPVSDIIFSMRKLTDEVAAARFRTVMELFEAGVDLQRQNLRRQFPDADEATIEARLKSWLLRENEPCDADGKTIKWPRVRE